jgi:DNA-binding MarR family transcriptional regulator
MRDMKRFMDDTGLSPTQVSALFRLHFGGKCGNSELAGHTGITDPAASQMVDRLVQRGLVERAEDPEDRRVKQLAITEAGRELVLKSVEMRQQWIEQLTGELDQEKQDAIGAALNILVEAALRLDAQDGKTHSPPGNS